MAKTIPLEKEIEIANDIRDAKTVARAHGVSPPMVYTLRIKHGTKTFHDAKKPRPRRPKNGGDDSEDRVLTIEEWINELIAVGALKCEPPQRG